MTRKSKLSSIKSGAFSRGIALARASVSAGAKVASHAMVGIFSGEDTKDERLRALLMSQVGLLTRELGTLKGSVMKVGQLLSMYGEKLLPPEANALLKSLQSESPPLAWPAISRALVRQLGAEKLALLEIEQESWASASLGQVHRATRKSDGRRLAMKIQYPGVDKSVDSDLAALRRILSLSKLVPGGPKYDELFKEVREMLHAEVDYERELETTDEFHRLLASDRRYVVPETQREFSTRRVLTTSFEEGLPVDSPEVLSLSQERRNALGLAALELYFRELFEWGKVQTDPHFGNYRIRLGVNGAPDQLVLLDFGAVRVFPKRFLVPYYEMVRGAFTGDRAMLEQGAIGLDFLEENDSTELRDAFAALCFMFLEPFQGAVYDWGASDLPDRAVRGGRDLVFKFRLRAPPREVVFLDRKMGGMFIFLSVLKVKADARPILEKSIANSVSHD